MNGALLTDLYQVTILQAYFDRGMHGPATFEFFVRRLPPRRNFLLAAGLEQVLQYLESLCFAPRELDFLAGTGRFTPAFLDRLAGPRFAGDATLSPVAIAPSVSALAAVVDERIARQASHGG